MPGLYLHIPFCKARCHYCDFTTFTGKNHLMAAYVDALIQEIEGKTCHRQPETIFIGGGTPTALDDLSFSKLMTYLSRFKVKEFSLEANPESVTDRKIEAMKAAGVNRVSLGLQSFDDDILRRIGRIHDAATFRKAFAALRRHGFSNLNFDLITGLPGQTKAMLGHSLSEALALRPEHISVYSLILEPETPFYHQVKKGQLILPDEATEADFQDMVHSRLTQAGYDHYEISNYALPGFNCQHNENYWQLGDYIACGVAAAGFEEGLRYTNTASLEDYLDRMARGQDPAQARHVNSPAETMEEFVFMGLRQKKGISLQEFQDRFHRSFASVYGTIPDGYIASGHLQLIGDRLSFKGEGFTISNYILADFLLS